MPPWRAIVVTGIEGTERKDDLILPPLSSLYFNYYCKDFVDFSSTVSSVPKLWSEWIKARHKKSFHMTLRPLNEHLGRALQCTSYTSNTTTHNGIYCKLHYGQWTHKDRFGLPAAHCTFTMHHIYQWLNSEHLYQEGLFKSAPKRNLPTTFSEWLLPPCHQNYTFCSNLYNLYHSQALQGIVNTFFQCLVSWRRKKLSSSSSLNIIDIIILMSITWWVVNADNGIMKLRYPRYWGTFNTVYGLTSQYFVSTLRMYLMMLCL